MQSGAAHVRNLTACPLSGLLPGEIADVSPLVDALGKTFIGNREFANLPRKFNIAVSGCGSNCTHPELHDIAVLAIPGEGSGEDARYTLRVGGQPSTSHFVSQDLNLRLSAAQVPDVCAAIVAVFRDNGCRTGRKKARMGHLIQSWGLPRFRTEVETALGRALPSAPPAPPLRSIHKDPIGVHPQSKAGQVFVGVPVPVGRLTLEQGLALAALVTRHGGRELRITARQNLILADLPKTSVDGVTDGLAELDLAVSASPIRAAITACSGNSYCKLATVETKHRTVDIAAHLENAGLADRPLTIALSACPNTCSLHSVADVGLQGAKTKLNGRTVEAFNLIVGGTTGEQTEFGRQVLKQIPGTELNEYLENALRVHLLRAQRQESFGDFCRRYDVATLAVMFTPQRSPQGPVSRWLAQRVVRLSGDMATTYA